MSNEKVSQLPTVANASLADVIYAIQGGVSSQETLQQVYNLFQSNVVQHYNGNPNSNLAGVVYQLCWDTTDNALWVCTTTGSASTAVWKPYNGAATNGQIPIGSTGQAPVLGTLTAGTNISISNGAGSITINAIGMAGIGWTNVTSGSQTMVADNGYVADFGTLCTLTLPATAAFGTVIYVQGLGAGGWQVAQNAGQQIIVGNSASTVGASGYIASSNRYNSITLLCVTANTTWCSLGGPQGNITVN